MPSSFLDVSLIRGPWLLPASRAHTTALSIPNSSKPAAQYCISSRKGAPVDLQPPYPTFPPAPLIYTSRLQTTTAFPPGLSLTFYLVTPSSPLTARLSSSLSSPRLVNLTSSVPPLKCDRLEVDESTSSPSSPYRAYLSSLTNRLS